MRENRRREKQRLHIYGGIRLRENRRKEKTKIAYLWRNKMHFGGQNVLVTGIDSRAETHRGRPLFFRHIQNHIPTFPNILEIRSQYFPIYSKSDPNIFQCIQNYISIYSKSHQNIFQYIQNHIPKYIQSKLYPKVFQPASNILHNIADISCDVSCVLIIIFVYLYICFFF